MLYNADMSFLKAHKNDILFILLMLLIAGGVWVYTLCNRDAGGEAVVTVDGEEVLRVPLSEPHTYIRQDQSGEVLNTVVVRDGRVCVVNANCPDKICVRTGWIQYDGQMIVCLPHKLIVTVVGGETGADALVQ